MKFLLISPIQSYYIGDFNVFYGVAPPLALLYLGRILEDEGEIVKTIDFSVEKYEEEKLINSLNQVDVVGLSLVSESAQRTNKIIKIIKEKDPTIKTIIGGAHPTLFPKKALIETGADISVQGDGEKTISEIKKAIDGKRALSEIPGVFYRKNNEIKSGPSTQLIKDLDTITFPARHLVKQYNYGLAYNPKMKKGDFTTIVTGRGCPYNCRFCSRGAACMHTYRTRSTNNIIDELKEIFNDGFKYVAFMDDSFLSNRRQAIDIFKKIINENIDLKFYVLAARVDSADKELYNLMKKAGVISLKFGLESGNQDVLDYYNKKTTIEKIRKAVNLSHDTGFFTHGTFILGAPFETKEHFRNTIRFAKSLPLDVVSFLSLRYMVGADLWTKAVEEGKISSDEYMVLADSKRKLGKYSQKEINKFCKIAHRAFTYRPGFVYEILKKSFRKDDLSLIQLFISFHFYYLKKNLNPLTYIKEKPMEGISTYDYHV